METYRHEFVKARYNTGMGDPNAFPYIQITCSAKWLPILIFLGLNEGGYVGKIGRRDKRGWIEYERGLMNFSLSIVELILILATIIYLVSTFVSVEGGRRRDESEIQTTTSRLGKESSNQLTEPN